MTDVRFRSDSIVRTFGVPGAMDHPAMAGNYMAYRGNRLRFGKLTMTDTDMILIDLDPKDPFDFYL